MKIILFLLAFVTTTCIAQEVPCPPNGSSTIAQQPPIKLTFTPPNNPKNTRPKPPMSDDRLVFWIHGLGGNPDSWAKVAQATQYQSPGQSVPGYPHRKITSLPLTYSQFSLSGAASTLHNMLISTGDALCAANNITDKTTNFIIAHSQGGIVSRSTDKMYDDLNMQEDRRFGGIVTFGTPHGGAQIINNLDQFVPFSQNACNALIAGPARDKLQNSKVVDFFVPEETFDGIKSKLCEILANDIAPITFKDQFQPITEDYKVGAAPLAELNGHSSNIPKVAFYGVEEEPVFYRTIYSLKVKTPNQFPVFGADEDQALVNNFNTLLNKYKAKYEFYKAEVDFWESEGIPCNIFNWICCNGFCLSGAQYRNAAKLARDDWHDGVNWLTSSNEMYKAIIGASKSEWVNTYQCNCNGFSFPTDVPSCPSGCSLASNGSYLSITQKPNDGVVLAESAADYPGAVFEEMPKSNHQQMRNDSNTKNKLSRLLGGDLGLYFSTSVR